MCVHLVKLLSELLTSSPLILTVQKIKACSQNPSVTGLQLGLALGLTLRALPS